MLYDQQGRVINYLRLAVTDRCNLRCSYCMPECGIEFSERADLLSFEEMLRIVKILAREGVSKVRITGGEPFVRRGIMGFIEELSSIDGIEKIPITTNGTLIGKYIDRMKNAGIRSVNLSLDSLDPERNFQITKRDNLHDVLQNLHHLIDAGFEVKLNMVVMSGINTCDISPMLELARNYPVTVRFLEEMPFNGKSQAQQTTVWSHVDILDEVRKHYPDLRPLSREEHATALNYRIAGFKGKFGIIASYTRTFCGSCNRLRLTPKGEMKTCLYDNRVVSLRDHMRAGASDTELLNIVKAALDRRAKDGHEAEGMRSNDIISESMASIGG